MTWIKVIIKIPYQMKNMITNEHIFWMIYCVQSMNAKPKYVKKQTQSWRTKLIKNIN